MAVRRYRPSKRQRDLNRYRLRRGVGEAFTVTRRQMRAAVEMQPSGAYDPLSLWDTDWWTAAVDRHIAPVLWEIYWESAVEAASVARRDPLAAYPDIERRWLTQVHRLYGFGDTVARRVDVVSDQGTGESKGWMLDRLGLVAAAGPLSDGIAEGMVATEELEASEGGASSALGGQGTKTWVASGPNPRLSHAEADGQTVSFDELFTVGGFDCLYPGDGDLPPEERINCYCSVEYAFEPTPSPQEVADDWLAGVPEERLAEVGEALPEPEEWVAADVVDASSSIDTTLRKDPTQYQAGDEWAEMDPFSQRGNIKVVQAGIDEVTAAIDSVHGMPDGLPPITWHQLPNSVTEEGAFIRTVREGPDGVAYRRLAVRGNSEFLQETIAHESGHYFDWADFDTPPGTFGSGRSVMEGGFFSGGQWQPVTGLSYEGVSPALRPLMDTFMDTPEYRFLSRTLRNAEPGVNMSMRQFEYLQYLLDPKEVFARGYAQFIALETGNPAMISQLARGLAADWPSQWTGNTFVPVQQEFRALLARTGLAR